MKNKILYGLTKFEKSANRYDWLGSGVYFWENDIQRAQSWAEEMHGKRAAVIGAKIQLGHCFDISNSSAKEILRIAYADLCKDLINSDAAIPVNRPHPKAKGNPDDNVLRYLDRVVIEHAMILVGDNEPSLFYDTVRAPFQEGFPVYPGSAFREHDHIHLCVRNAELLVDLFDPEEVD
ncbi:hypothetical protein MUK70_29020 [Dyadobacter chenwenxiniae]|uniref:Uncharacterized protein n=1 Tax=Dyadobacter chenwenxiniae TaxID=2906456 RepID=A0A9X1PR17_9BACT|nr:hypothetical protein [Dyadobacter chenwenxiniae]MCF0064925.1 hypothetical protein [Dyadobacter chenwenxiniae]UON83047.1 hypothetical protein MUK70_29020 [Dyadobacter chenwenxiniae]